MRPVALGHAPRGETERVHRPTEPSGEPCPPDGLVTRLHRQRPTQRLREDYRGAEISAPPVGVHAPNSSAQRVGQVRSRGRHSPADGESDRAPAAESHGSHALLTRFTRGGDLVGLRQHDKEARHLRPGHEIRGPITRSIGRASARSGLGNSVGAMEAVLASGPSRGPVADTRRPGRSAGTTVQGIGSAATGVLVTKIRGRAVMRDPARDVPLPAAGPRLPVPTASGRRAAQRLERTGSTVRKLSTAAVLPRAMVAMQMTRDRSTRRPCCGLPDRT